MDTNRQVDKKITKQVRIDAGLHQLLKVEAARRSMSIKDVIETCLAELLAIKPLREGGNEKDD